MNEAQKAFVVVKTEKSCSMCLRHLCFLFLDHVVCFYTVDNTFMFIKIIKLCSLLFLTSFFN